MYKLTQKFLVVSLLALAGCEGEANSGRLVGFIVDGQTGQRLNFFKAADKKNNLGDDGDSQSQVYAVIDGEFRRAEPCGRGDLNDKNGIEADGCFQIKDIPEGMSFPLFAQAPGYERFVGEYSYSMLDLDVEHAQVVGNIRLFPKGFSVDYRFNVTFNNQPVANAQVFCQYTASTANTLQVSGNFLTPANTGTTTIAATSDAEGVAVIPGAQLVNGASYRCEAVMSQTLDGRTLSGRSTITAGVTQADQLLLMSTASSTDDLLYAVRSNADDGTKLMGQTGKLIITFNRAVEIVPETADCQVATATAFDTDGDGRTGTLITDVRNNPPTTYSNASESVSADISTDGLTLTLGFKTEAGFEFDPDDRGTYISFSGIIVRPRGAADTTQVRYIGSAVGCPAVSGYSTAEMMNLRIGTSQRDYIQLF